MRPVTVNIENVQAALKEIMAASHEADITEMAQNYSVTGAYTATRALNAGSPTLANVVAVLATLISDLQKGGLNRTT